MNSIVTSSKPTWETRRQWKLKIFVVWSFDFVSRWFSGFRAWHASSAVIELTNCTKCTKLRYMYDIDTYYMSNNAHCVYYCINCLHKESMSLSNLWIETWAMELMLCRYYVHACTSQVECSYEPVDTPAATYVWWSRSHISKMRMIFPQRYRLLISPKFAKRTWKPGRIIDNFSLLPYISTSNVE